MLWIWKQNVPSSNSYHGSIAIVYLFIRLGISKQDFTMNFTQFLHLCWNNVSSLSLYTNHFSGKQLSEGRSVSISFQERSGDSLSREASQSKEDMTNEACV